MDIVITYVNGNDPLWNADYRSAVGGDAMSKRFRDWGTLQFLLRGIGENIPFVRKVHLVVSRESQVPDWVDRSRVNVVLHRDFIPHEYLPLFNSSSIEVFLHRIPGLDEQFVYLNDDFFPVRPCSPDTFFRDGRPVIRMRRHILALNSYKKRIRLSDSLARDAAGVGDGMFFLRPQHICYNLLRSSCEELFELRKDEILKSVTPVRGPFNYNVSLYLDYIHMTHRSVNRRISSLHLSLGAVTSGILKLAIAFPLWDFLCINDVKMGDSRFRRLQSVIVSQFSKLFPDRSVFELK